MKSQELAEIHAAVWRIVTYHRLNVHDAHDVLQTVLCSWWAATEPRPDLAAVRRLAQNACRRLRRDRRRRAAYPDPELATFGENPADLAEREEVAAIVRERIAQLPTKYANVIQLRYWHGAKPAQIALATAEPLNTVNSRLQRAKKMVRDSLAL